MKKYLFHIVLTLVSCTYMSSVTATTQTIEYLQKKYYNGVAADRYANLILTCQNKDLIYAIKFKVSQLDANRWKTYKIAVNPISGRIGPKQAVEIKVTYNSGNNHPIRFSILFENLHYDKKSVDVTCENNLGTFQWSDSPL